MPDSHVKTIRVSQDLLERVNTTAGRLGISFNEFATHALEVALGNKGDENIGLLADLTQWVEGNFDRTAFPPDVTLLVFHHLRDDRKLRRKYDASIHDPSGRTNWDALISVHRRIGRMVKRVLAAEVFGRSLALDPKEHLIKAHALLRPSSVKSE